MPDPDQQVSASSGNSPSPASTGHRQASGSTAGSGSAPTQNDTLKDITIEYLAHRSEFRWNALTALMLLVTVLYLIVLAVEFYRKGQLDDALMKLNADIADRAARTALYSNTLKDILLTDFDVDSSSRVFDQKRYLLADRYLNRGIDRLESRLASLSSPSVDQRLQALSFDSNTCAVRERDAAAEKNVADGATSSLVPIVKDRLAIAYGTRIFQHYTDIALRERTDIALKPPMPSGLEPSLHRDAYAAATLDPNALGIFHWLGIAEIESGDFDHARHCFERSIHQSEPHGVDDLITVDYINLAELSFFKGKCCYGEVERLAGRFLNLERDEESAADVERTTVAKFYQAVARYLQSEGGADHRSTELKRFCGELKNKRVNFSGRFSPKELDEYIAKPPRLEDISKEQLADIRAAIDCWK